MRSRIDLIDRLGRPLLRLCGVAFIVIVIWFVVRIMAAIVYAYDQAATTGASVPDLSGGLGSILTPILASLPIIVPLIVDQLTRHRERMDQQSRGTAPGPFGASSPQASDSAQTPPASDADTDGPRPWQNRQ